MQIWIGIVVLSRTSRSDGRGGVGEGSVVLRRDRGISSLRMRRMCLLLVLWVRRRIISIVGLQDPHRGTGQ